jgi:acyl-CoA synthetase (NDP forming)
MDRLQALISPRTVALIGASENTNKLTARPMSFLKSHGFTGDIFPVNPNHDMINGSRAYKSVEDIPAKIDFAYIMVGTAHVISALEDCARAKVKVVSILADGFSEKNEAGRRLQAKVVEIAKEAGIFLLGPNSMGVVDTRSRFSCTTNAAFRTGQLESGRYAVISQSGSLIGTLLSRGNERGVNFCTYISVGNEACVGVGDIGSLLLNDNHIQGFILFLETVRDPTGLAQFARRAFTEGKPVIAYMVGQSDEAQALAVSHTGAMVGNIQAIKAYFKSVGISQVEQFDAILEAPAVLDLRNQIQKRSKKVTVVSTTGGGGAMVIDQLALRGVEIAPCPETVRASLSAKNISIGTSKLVDVTLAGTKYEVMKAVISEIIEHEDTGIVLVAIGSSAQFNPDLAVSPIIDAVEMASSKAAPVLGFPLPHAISSMQKLEASGVPTFRTVESCADCVSLLTRNSPPTPIVEQRLEPSSSALISSANSGTLNEIESSTILRSLGLRYPNQYKVATNADLSSMRLKYPVVAKLVSRDLVHKTEMGAIRTDIQNKFELKDAISEMLENLSKSHIDIKVDEVLVQEMENGVGEALIGFTRDPVVGPIVTVAAGGILAEVYKDYSVHPAPVSIETAQQMIQNILGFEPMRGYRGMPKGDLDALAKCISLVSKLALNSDIAEAEINPIIVKREGCGATCVDALVRKY